MSNWNNLDEVAWRLTHEDGLKCRFLPLDADSRTIHYGGVIQNYELCGMRSFDFLMAYMKAFHRGIQQSPTTTLVNPLWKEFPPWPPPSLVPYPDRSPAPQWAMKHNERTPPPREVIEWGSPELFPD